MKIQILFLGTGTSGGVPEIGCNCSVCTSKNPKNKRLRTSSFLTFQKENKKLHILIDTSPDLRQQALLYNLTKLDAVLYTHDHYDHIAGLDELRRFNYLNQKVIPVYGDNTVIRTIKNKYSYIFNPLQLGGGVPQIDLHTVQPNNSFNIDFLSITPLLVFHGKLKILGYRFGSLAYITDASFLPEETMTQLHNLDILILNSLRYQLHPTHFNLDQSLKIVDQLKPKQTYFVHLTHFFDHTKVNNALPNNAQLAYDGLILTINN